MAFTSDDWASFHANACSLPPPPITRTVLDMLQGKVHLNKRQKVQGFITKRRTFGKVG